MAIIPYLHQLRIAKIDAIVISHPDLDHRGGLQSLEEEYPGAKLIVDNPGFYQRGINCHQQPAWDWEGVHFQFLPINLQTSDKNNTSCILKISTSRHSILLTGDIEKKGEKFLLQTQHEYLAASYLVLAHHGSKSSSTLTFIQAVHPSYALISAGFDNRFHFPHSKTLQTLANFAIPVFSTINCGMISINLQENKVNLPTCYQPLAH